MRLRDSAVLGFLQRDQICRDSVFGIQDLESEDLGLNHSSDISLNLDKLLELLASIPLPVKWR
jgi:hypothetical protein